MRQEIEFFDKTSRQYLTEYDRPTSDGYSFRIRRKKVLDLIEENQRGKTALDSGCGPGIMIEGLLKKGYKIECQDAAPQMIKLARQNYSNNQNVKFSVGDATKLSFPDQSFDLVTAMGLLEYLENQEQAIKEIARVLKPGASAVITFPNKKSPWRTINRLVLATLRPTIKKIRRSIKKESYFLKHREYITSDVKNLLAKHGLYAEKIVFYNFKLIPYPLDRIFPRLTIWQSKIFEKLDKTFLKFIGTGFIAKATKK